jgi:hypothetical protein
MGLVMWNPDPAVDWEFDDYHASNSEQQRLLKVIQDYKQLLAAGNLSEEKAAELRDNIRIAKEGLLRK